MRSESTSALGQPSETKEIFGAAFFSALAKGRVKSLVWVIFGRVCRYWSRLRPKRRETQEAAARGGLASP